MDITPFIRELLFSHDCVIVPGFGGFIGNYAPARIDDASSTFYPPVKQISFNRNLNSNDGLLAGRISGHSGITFNEAVSMIEEFTGSVRKRIENGEKVVFDNLGTFTRNHEGSIQFEPDRNVNYLPGSYGLESFQFSPAGGYDVRKQITRHIDKDPERGHSARVFLWRAAIIVPLIALATLIPLKTSLLRPKIEATTLNPLVKTGAEALVKSEPESNPAVMVIPEEVKQPTSDKPELTAQTPAANDTPIQIPEGHFRLITGSFRLKINAEQQASLLKEEGFDPEIITAANGFFRVSALRCNDLSTAIEKKDSLIKKFPGTWVRKI
jgi:hypothetical protein